MDHQQPHERDQREAGAGQEGSLRPVMVPEATCNDAAASIATPPKQIEKNP